MGKLQRIGWALFGMLVMTVPQPRLVGQPTAPIKPSFGTSLPSVSPQVLSAQVTRREALQAIIQLQEIQLPAPKVQGQDTIALQPIENGTAWTVTLTINGKQGEFLLDTGASLTLLSADWLAKFNLTPDPLPPEAAEFAIAGKDCQAPTVQLYRLPTVQLGEARVTNLQALQLSSALIPAGLDGVLGMDVLAQFEFHLNPGNRTLTLQSAPYEPVNEISSTAIPLTRKKGVLLAEVSLNQQVPRWFLIDTGAESTFISPTVAEALQLPDSQLQPIQVQGFCGLEPAQYGQLAQVQMGQHRQQTVEVVILSNVGVLDSLGVAGVLGQNFLNAYEQHWYPGATPHLKLTPFEPQE